MSAEARQALLNGIYDRYRTSPHPALRRLREAARDKFVPGVGDVEAELVLVGEAPSATEHRTGQPFVGASGRVLDDLLASVGLPRARVYITNAVHYRPLDEEGRNRTPDPAEIAASREYLMQELEVLRPLVVATLGKAPLSALMGATYRISDCHGQVHRSEQVPYSVVTLYHPAVGVYQGSQRPMLRRDFAEVSKELHRKGAQW